MHEIPLVMPKMSMTMTEGELVAWHIQEGDTVEAGQVVCDVGTDKVDMEVEAPAAGRVSRLLAKPGDVVQVGEPLAHITAESEGLLAGLLTTTPDATAGAGAQEPPPPSDGDRPLLPAQEPDPPDLPDAPDTREARIAADGPAAAGSGGVAGPSRVLALPGARRRAADNGLRLDLIPGSGPGGVITFRDVEEAAARARPLDDGGTNTGGGTNTSAGTGKAATEEKDTTEQEVLRRRRAVRGRHVERLLGAATIPQSTIWRELDLDRLARRRGGLSWTTLLLRALATALRETPELVAERAAERSPVVITLAVDSVYGLVSASFTDPDLGTVEETDTEVRRTVDRARHGRVAPSHLVPGMVGLFSLGELGAERFTMPVTPPQAAVLTVGAIGERVAVTGGGIHVRTGCTAGLAVDHRVADAADGARLLGALASAVSDPDRLLRPRPYDEPQGADIVHR